MVSLSLSISGQSQNKEYLILFMNLFYEGFKG